MQRFMLKSKIHRATITEANLEYEGSLTVDRDLMDAAGLLRKPVTGRFGIWPVSFRPYEEFLEKLDSAVRRLQELNPHVEVVAHETRLTSRNAMEIIGGYDVVADGTDRRAIQALGLGQVDAAVVCIGSNLSGIPHGHL